MKPATTPGPWTQTERLDALDLGLVVAQDGTEIAIVHVEANARLIAAAPELREALVYMLDAQKQPFDHADRRACLAQARAALAKADGEEG